jgi:hypothetical protein
MRGLERVAGVLAQRTRDEPNALRRVTSAPVPAASISIQRSSPALASRGLVAGDGVAGVREKAMAKAPDAAAAIAQAGISHVGGPSTYELVRNTECRVNTGNRVSLECIANWIACRAMANTGGTAMTSAAPVSTDTVRRRPSDDDRRR